MLRASLTGLLVAVAAIAATPSTITFNKDVLPVLQKNCQTCHRPGEVAPMSSYLHGRTPVGESDQGGGADEEDATVVR